MVVSAHTRPIVVATVGVVQVAVVQCVCISGACCVHRACASGIRCAQHGTGMAQHWVPLVSRDLGLGWWLARWARDGMPLCAYCMGCAVCACTGYMQ